MTSELKDIKYNLYCKYVRSKQRVPFDVVDKFQHELIGRKIEMSTLCCDLCRKESFKLMGFAEYRKDAVIVKQCLSCEKIFWHHLDWTLFMEYEGVLELGICNFENNFACNDVYLKEYFNE